MPIDRDRRSFIEKLGVLGGASIIAGCSSGGGGDGGNGGGGGGGSSGEAQELVIGSVYASGHVINEMAGEWADEVREQTDGRIDITIEASFGGEKDVMEQTSIGAIQGTAIGAMWIIQYDSKNFWVESPFVFEDWEQQKRAVTGEYLDDGRQRLRDDGNQKLVSPPVYRGFRHTSGNEPYETPAAIEGVNLRVPGLDAWANIWEGIGANPTTVAFDELYSALQQGVVNAQENPAEAVQAKSLHEVQSHYTLTKHLASTGWITINTDTLNEMSDDDQTIVEDTLATKVNNLSDEIAEKEQETIDALSDEGMNIVDADRDAWLSAAEPVLKAQFEQNWEPSLEDVRNI